MQRGKGSEVKVRLKINILFRIVPELVSFLISDFFES
jgi:hypothetical protein